jgi:uncharacterized protein (TIGR00369 family)
LTEIWKEPARGEVLGTEFYAMPARERMEASVFGKNRPVPPVARLLGISVTQVGHGTMTCNAPVTGWLQDPTGRVDPTFLADTAMLWMVQSAMPAMVGVDTVQLHVNFVRTVMLDAVNLIAKARAIHVGRSYAVAEVEIEDARGRLMAHAVGRYAIGPVHELGAPPLLAEGGGAYQDPYMRPPAGRVIGRDRWLQALEPQSKDAWIAAFNDTPLRNLYGVHIVDVEEGVATSAMPK